MKMLKTVANVGLTLTLAFSLSACSSTSSTSGSGDSKADGTGGKSADSGKKVTIVFARGKDVTQGSTKIVEAFEKTHPNIKVDFREMPSDSGQSHDQYVTMLSAKSSDIDVFDLDVIWPAEFAQAGYLLPLDRFIEKDKVNMDDYIQGAVDAGNYDGKQWTIPKFIDTGLLFYRKDLVKQPPKTWDELIAQAKKTKGQGGTQFGYLMQAKQYEGLVCNFVEFVSSYGGKILDDKGNIVINSPQTIKGLNKMKEIVNSNFVPNNIKTFTELESHTAFIEGQSPFIRNWPYQYALAQDKKQSKIVDKVGVAPLPAGDAGSAAALGGWQTGINKYSKHPEEAWEFVKFMTGPEGEKLSAQYGGNAPTYLPDYKDKDVQAASPLFANEEFVKGVSKAVSRPVTPIYTKISDIIQIEVSKALSGGETSEQAVKNMETKMKEAMSK